MSAKHVCQRLMSKLTAHNGWFETPHLRACCAWIKRHQQCSHIKACCLRRSRGCSELNALEGEPGEVCIPRYHLMAIWCSFGYGPGDGMSESHAKAGEEDTCRRQDWSIRELWGGGREKWNIL